MSFTKDKTGFEGRLTPQQETALVELKTRLEKSEYAAALQAHPDGDRWILRFLRATMKDKHGARIFQVDPAEARVLKVMAWRKKYNVEETTRAIIAGEGKSVIPDGIEIFSNQFPSLYLADPESGEVFRFDRFAKSASHVVESALTVDQWCRCVAYTMETTLHMLREQSKAHGKEITTYTTVVDASGVSLTGIVARRKFVQFMSDLGAENYPESLGKTFLINCPWYFDKIWSLVKPFIDKDTLGKLCVNSGIPMDEMLKLIPKAFILKEFGGEHEAVLPQPVFT